MLCLSCALGLSPLAYGLSALALDLAAFEVRIWLWPVGLHIRGIISPAGVFIARPSQGVVALSYCVHRFILAWLSRLYFDYVLGNFIIQVDVFSHLAGLLSRWKRWRKREPSDILQSAAHVLVKIGQFYTTLGLSSWRSLRLELLLSSGRCFLAFILALTRRLCPCDVHIP